MFSGLGVRRFKISKRSVKLPAKSEPGMSSPLPALDIFINSSTLQNNKLSFISILQGSITMESGQ